METEKMIEAEITFVTVDHDNSVPGCRYEIKAIVRLDGENHDVKFHTNDPQYYEDLFDDECEEEDDQDRAIRSISKKIIETLENDLEMVSGSVDIIRYRYLGNDTIIQ